MKAKQFLFFVLIIIIFGWSCSSSTETVKNAGGPDSNSTVSSDPNVPAGSNLANAESPMPGTFAEQANRKKRLVESDVSGTPVPPQFQKAPEDSEIAVTMNPDGTFLEIRRFNSHPQLSRVKATWLDVKEKALKIYLKNGKVIEAKTDRIANLQSATTSTLLEIAGLQPASQPADRSRAKEKKLPVQ